jgi:hypothetical protein
VRMQRLEQKEDYDMITEIGIVAGEIWHFLDHHGDVSLTRLTRDIDKPRDNVTAITKSACGGMDNPLCQPRP